MKKLIQSIILSAVVLAPVSSLDLVADAMMHHTPSHVSTLSLEGTRNRQKYRKYRQLRNMRKVRVRVPKSLTKKAPNQKSISREQTPVDPTITIPASNPPTSNPSIANPPAFVPLNPGAFPPDPQLKQIDPIMGNPVNAPRNMTLPNPASGTPTIPLTIPGGIPNPSGDMSIPNPNLPITLPGGSIK